MGPNSQIDHAIDEPYVKRKSHGEPHDARSKKYAHVDNKLGIILLDAMVGIVLRYSLQLC